MKKVYSELLHFEKFLREKITDSEGMNFKNLLQKFRTDNKFNYEKFQISD